MNCKHRTGLAKVAVMCSADTFVVNQSLVLRINICGENATFAKPETVMCHPIEASCTYTITHDFAARPHAIFSTWQGRQTLTQSQPCQELKMPMHSPPTPADEYLSTFVLHFSNTSLLDTMPTRHPFDRILKTSVTIWLTG